jgi:hypothetical protein
VRCLARMGRRTIAYHRTPSGHARGAAGEAAVPIQRVPQADDIGALYHVQQDGARDCREGESHEAGDGSPGEDGKCKWKKVREIRHAITPYRSSAT